jgi:nitrite reductase (NADH) small subunit
MAWHDVAGADLADGVHRVELGDGRGLALVRRADRWWALRDACPHQGARLSAGVLTGTVPPCLPGEEIRMEEDEPVVVCPWHGWEYDVHTGCSLHEPQRHRVRAYPVKVEENRVWVDVKG